jgi:hypothetical protein
MSKQFWRYLHGDYDDFDNLDVNVDFDDYDL